MGVFLGLITVWERILVGVVKQAVIAISPGEGLSPDAHVFIRREIRPVVVCGTGTKVDESTKGHNREADKIGGHFPILAATIMASLGTHASGGGAKEAAPSWSFLSQT